MSLAWVLFTLVIAAAVIGSGLLGRVEGYTRGQREALLSGLTPEPADPWEVDDPDRCRCGHGRQTHVHGEKSCVVALDVAKGTTCACMVFTVKRRRRATPPGELDL